VSLWSLLWPLGLVRSCGRTPSGRVVDCHIIALPEFLPLPVTIHGLSTRSLGLVSRAAVDTGSFLALTLEGARGFKRFLRACVVQATPRDDGDWVLDCEFSRHLTGEELTALL
jgi:hypothetical protein